MHVLDKTEEYKDMPWEFQNDWIQIYQRFKAINNPIKLQDILPPVPLLIPVFNFPS
jgi:hypothetical protein